MRSFCKLVIVAWACFLHVTFSLQIKTHFNEKTIFVGNDVEKEIRKLGLRPTSPQLSWFYKKVRNFHLTACEYLQKYFKSTLTSSVLESAAALNPLKQSHVLTSRRLKYLVDNYPLVVENIQKVGGIEIQRTLSGNHIRHETK